MRLVSITVERYRSISKAHKIPFDRSTIIVGPNNEGKSNILRAFVAAMRTLTAGAHRQLVRRRGERLIEATFSSRRFYKWTDDFPLQLQQTKPKGKSVIILEFELTPDEIVAFRTAIKSRLTGTLPLKVEFTRTEEVSVSVYKKGPGASALSKKSARIAAFVSQRLSFVHIPAVRTAQSAQRVVNDLIEDQLRGIEEQEEYKQALGAIERLQQPYLDEVSATLKTALSHFLPSIQDVRVQVESERRTLALRRAYEVIVDDGTATRLQQKGDGVQSLAALALLRYTSEIGARGRNLVIAIEEPESHLHPRAIHELKDILEDLSSKHQLVVTTHNPLFVDRPHIGSNILVHRQRARPAKSIEEVREILGVRAADNLRHAELVLLVEGTTDITMLRALLAHHFPEIGAHLEDGVIGLDAIGGAGNLSYKAGLLRQSLCTCYCYLDDDEAAHRAFEQARIDGVLTDADVTFCVCPGMSQAEVEDLISMALYSRAIKERFGVDVTESAARSAKKWSERMQNVFRSKGKAWNSRVERDLKAIIAHAVEATPADALLNAKRSSFDALSEAIREKSKDS